MKVYLAGKITGDPNYREKFAAAAKKLEERAGVTVISPAVTPERLKKADYMRICFAMIDVADEVWMMQNAIYSILSPEGFASILWKDGKRAPEAAEVMKLTAGDLKELGIVEEIVEEPGEFTVDTMPVVCEELRGKILRFLEKYEKMDGEELVEERYRRFRDM